jgi:hypothetical protein
MFFLLKIREQEGGTGSAWGRKKGRKMNMVPAMYTHVCKCKNDTCCNCSRNGKDGGREVKGGNSSMIYLIHC